MKKVLHLRSSGQLLGAERVVLELANYLPDFGYHSIVGVPVEDGEGVPEFATHAQQAGFEVVLFPIKSAFDFSIRKKIKRFVQENDVSIIHSHGYREDFYAFAARSVCKLFATNHLWKRTTTKLKIYAKLDAYLLNYFDHIIAVSKPVESDMLRCGIAKSKITVVPNGIDVARCNSDLLSLESRRSLAVPENQLVIGTLSSLTSEKGINFIIEAIAEVLKQLPDIHLMIVGEGADKEALVQQVENAGLQSSVSFVGRRSDISNVLNAMDIFVLPSLNEGLPMSLLEAMAASKAVIATAVGDVPDVIDSVSGILVPPASTEPLVDAICKLVKDVKLRESYGRCARERIDAHFSAKKMAENNAKLYSHVLES